MRRSYSALFRSAGTCVLAPLILVTVLSQAQETASLHGTIRDSQGKPVAGASVRLQPADITQTQTVHTDPQGNYKFEELRGGVYVLRGEMAGLGAAEIPSLFFGPKEAKSIDLTLLPIETPASQAASVSTPQFLDEPQFSVAGVTDTTSLGGHGSDTIVRTRESLAKETVSLGKGSTVAENGSASETERTLRARLEREPLSFDSNNRLGKALVDNGKAPEAIPYLEHARELRPTDYENAYDLALAYARAGNYEHARANVQALLEHSNKPELHHLLGDVHENLGDPLDAVREYQRAAEVDTTEPYVFDWGSELLLHHAPEPALEVFTKGNHLFPRSVRMLIGLGAASFARGDYGQAVQRICEASDIDPNDATPYLFLGKMQRAESTPSDEVVQKLHRFVAQRPANAEANYYYAVALWKLRKGSQDTASAAQVESFLRRAIALDSEFGAAYLQLGILHSEHKDYPGAISDYQHAIQADPTMEEAHYRLAQAYRLIGDAAKSAAEVQIYDQIAKESAQRADRERHEIRQFVYTLRDQPPAKTP